MTPSSSRHATGLIPTGDIKSIELFQYLTETWKISFPPDFHEKQNKFKYLMQFWNVLDVHVWSFYRLLPRSSYIQMLEEIPHSQSRSLQFYLRWTQSDWPGLRNTVTWKWSWILFPDPRFFHIKANISLKLESPQSSSWLEMTLFFCDSLRMTPKIALKRSCTVSIVLIPIVYKLSFAFILFIY